jgi:hypothetical protein
MTAKIINFPSEKTKDDTSENEAESAFPALKPGIEIDRELDRVIRGLDEDDPVRMNLQYGTNTVAFSNVFRILRKKPKELLVFCNTISEDSETGVPWGDVYCLTDEEIYRYIFTLFTASYVKECQMRRGEIIPASAENIILPVPELTLQHLILGMELWVKEYYPGLAGIPVRLESPDAVREMITSSLDEDPA